MSLVAKGARRAEQRWLRILQFFSNPLHHGLHVIRLFRCESAFSYCAFVKTCVVVLLRVYFYLFTRAASDCLFSRYLSKLLYLAGRSLGICSEWLSQTCQHVV